MGRDKEMLAKEYMQERRKGSNVKALIYFENSSQLNS